jgi:transposase
MRHGTTVGVDLGDRWSQVCVLGLDGEVERSFRVRTTRTGLSRGLAEVSPCRVALETGTASPWVSRLLEESGFEVIVSNARQVRLIGARDKKTDATDAELLARLARMDPKLLAPVKHRSAPVQADREILRAREAAVRVRTDLINHVRGVVKAWGERLPSCSSRTFARKARPELPEELREVLEPLLDTIAELTVRILAYDGRIEAVSSERYPVTAHLRAVPGVGPKTALAYVLAVEDPVRFDKSRKLGAYFGLCPRQDQSGTSDPQCRITKAGDALVRRLLLQCAHYMLGPFGKDTDLRRWAQAKMAHGGRAAKKRALVAVARRLAVLLHRLWVTGEIYDPLWLAKRRSEAA